MRRTPTLLLASLVAACSSTVTTGTGGHGGVTTTTTSSTGGKGTGGTGATTTTDAGPEDAPADVTYDVTVIPPPDGAIMNPCSLPGSVQFTTSGVKTVPGGSPNWPSLAFLHLPSGFCAHYFGTVGNARQLRFAPGGELFVASPTTGTTGGGAGGQNAIVVLPDDNLDGIADAPVTFKSGLPSTQGLLFAPSGYFYYQDTTKIVREAYTVGQRTSGGPGEVVANITYSVDTLHWPKPMDIADDGSIYVGNGGSQSDPCIVPHPFKGGIRKISPAPGGDLNGAPIAQGFRNPISVRCARGHNRCFALELALDYSATSGGREKMVPIRQGDDWGFPCCASANLPYTSSPAGTDCSGTAAETNSFFIGDTPFDVDFERGFWPGSWNGQAYLVTHGAAGSWTGARMVAIPMDPATGLPKPSNNLANETMDVGMVDFATGWDDHTLSHGRPSAVAFGPDGRLYVANDSNGMIFWIAPM